MIIVDLDEDREAYRELMLDCMRSTLTSSVCPITRFHAQQTIHRLEGEAVDSLDIQELIRKCLCRLRDVPSAKGFDTVQLKYDGWWGLGVYQDGQAIVYSKGAMPIMSFHTSWPDGVYVGEAIVRTNWAMTAREKNRFYVHDIYEPNVVRAYVQRMEKLWVLPREDNTRYVSTWTLSEDGNEQYFWNRYVVEDGYEGLVFKNSFDTGFGPSMSAGRRKMVFTRDYVVMHISEGGGRLRGTCGAIGVGLYRNGNLVNVMSVGGGLSDTQRNEIWASRDSWIGKVIEVAGSPYAPGSNTLRHPRFVRVRPDKSPLECEV